MWKRFSHRGPERLAAPARPRYPRSAMPTHASPAFALRRHLVTLVVAAVAPVVVFATIMVVVFGRGERASTDSQTSRAV